LPNRALFLERLADAVLGTAQSGAAVALMFLDLDGFKQVNDTLGHQGGDELLIKFSRRLSSLVRKTDTMARLAGDEFTIVLADLMRPDEEARAVAAKIVASMRQPFSIAGRDVTVTVSLGLVIHRSGSGDVSELLRRADLEMYAAKHAGKNTYRMA